MSFISFIEIYRNYILATFFVLIFIWENIIPQRRFHDLFKHNLINFGYGILNLALTFWAGFYFGKYLDFAAEKNIGLLNQIAIRVVVKFAIAFLIADIIMYWWHRFNHTIPFLWRFHSFHHKDEQMNATTAVRFHVMELFYSFIFQMILYPLFGIGSMMVIAFSTIHFSMLIFHHSNIYLPAKIDKIVRLFITSPGMHRIHHSDKWEETNSNYTSILSCWDWAFGSYIQSAKGEIKFGMARRTKLKTNTT